jgi:hypothetical protein
VSKSPKVNISLIAGVTGGRGVALHAAAVLSLALSHQKAAMDVPVYVKPIQPKPRPPVKRKKLRKLKIGKGRL